MGKRITPSAEAKQELNRLFEDAEGYKGELLERVLELGITAIVNGALEKEVEGYLGRGYYERRGDGTKRDGWRNGYEDRYIKTAEGKFKVKTPQVRNTEEVFRSKILPHLKKRTENLARLAVEMYVRGLSTRDIEETFRLDDGSLLLSKSRVSELTEALWEQYEAFQARDLSEPKVVYLFLDAVYEPMRLFRSPKEGLLVAWGITETGDKVLLSLALGNRESFDAWLGFLRDIVNRGLGEPALVTSDGASGLIRAIETAWPYTYRQRCLVHKKNNVLEKVPEKDKAEVKTWLDSIYYAPNRYVADEMAAAFVNRYGDEYPSAVKSFQDDLDASLSHLYFPENHRRHIRTTNTLERAFGEQKRRTKVIPRFFTEKSCLALVFSTLIRAAESWNRITITDDDKKRIEEITQSKKPDTVTTDRKLFALPL